MHQLSNLVVLLLFLLSSSHKISLVSAASPSDGSMVHDSGIEVVGKFGPVKHAHFEPGNTAERKYLHVQSLHSDSDTNLDGNMNQGLEEFDSTPTPSHPVVRAEEEDDSSPFSETDAPSPPNVASKTIPVELPSPETSDEDHSETPFDHYHILGTRTGSSDSTLEKRRVCPAQPLPSNRGCTCPNQTICKIRNHRTCVQLGHDHENCGSCSLRCGTTQYCEGGKCHCERPNFSVCGKSCYNLKNNEEHCGKCGVVCGRGKTCIRGACKRA